MYSMKYIIAKILRKIFNPPAINHSHVDKTARCDVGCNVSYSKMGRYSYIGQYTALSYVEIGNFTAISAGCSIGGGSHPTQWVAMSPVFQAIGIGRMKKKFANHTYETHRVTHIGNDVWIGADCLIKGGINIADGAVIGMGSVVTHDVGPYEVWAGNPARIIRKRFDEETIKKMLLIQWWNWTDDELALRSSEMNNVTAFLKKWYQEE